MPPSVTGQPMVHSTSPLTTHPTAVVYETNALTQTIPPISALLSRRRNSSTTDNDDEDWGDDEPKKIRVSNPAPIVEESTVLTQTAPTNVIAGVSESEVQILYFYCFAFRLKIF